MNESGPGMDKYFLEWWGNFLLSVARGQRQMADMDRWLSRGFEGFPDLTEMMKRAYGLADEPRQTPDTMAQWREANEQFLNSYAELLSSMGVVPKADHLRLVKRYEALKEKADEQEETIRHLRMLVNEKGPDTSEQAAAAEGFQEILQRQTEQFRDLMGSLSRFYGDASPSSEDDSS